MKKKKSVDWTGIKWRYLYLLSAVSGLLLSAAWPAHGFAPFLLVALVPLLIVEHELISRKAENSPFTVFKFVFTAFMIFNSLTTWWIWNSTLFGGIMALFINSTVMSTAFTLIHIIRRNLHKTDFGIFLIAIMWVCFEYFHLDWDLNWTWLNLGNGFATEPKLIQWYEYTGAFGGTFWIWISNILIFLLVMAVRNHVGKVIIFLRSAMAIIWIAVPIILSLVIFNRYQEKYDPVDVVITQPNLDPYSEQYTVDPQKVIQLNQNLALQLMDSTTRFMICPESAIQEQIWLESIDYAPSVTMLKEFVIEHPGLNVVIGASTFKRFKDGEPLTKTARKFTDTHGHYDAFNTSIVINDKGKVAYYHKSRLVPGVERMPFQRLLAPLQNLAFDLGGTVGSLGRSPERTVFETGDRSRRYSSIICYESVDGGFVSEFVRNGAEAIFIITNDGWWGNTPGHRQHLTFATLRAIENRRCIARSANTGISCFVDQRGVISQNTPYWKEAVIRQKINFNNKLTFYSKNGDYIARLSSYISALLALVAFVNGILERSKRIGFRKKNYEL